MLFYLDFCSTGPNCINVLLKTPEIRLCPQAGQDTFTRSSLLSIWKVKRKQAHRIPTSSPGRSSLALPARPKACSQARPPTSKARKKRPGDENDRVHAHLTSHRDQLHLPLKLPNTINGSFRMNDARAYTSLTNKKTEIVRIIELRLRLGVPSHNTCLTGWARY